MHTKNCCTYFLWIAFLSKPLCLFEHSVLFFLHAFGENCFGANVGSNVFAYLTSSSSPSQQQRLFILNMIWNIFLTKSSKKYCCFNPVPPLLTKRSTFYLLQLYLVFIFYLHQASLQSLEDATAGNITDPHTHWINWVGNCQEILPHLKRESLCISVVAFSHSYFMCLLLQIVGVSSC